MNIKYQISKIKDANQRLRIGNKTIKFCVLTCIFDILFLIFNSFSAYSPAYAWKLPIEVATYTDTSEKVYNKLVVGIEPDATNGFDNLWDTPAILSRPDPDSPPALRAYITPTPPLLLQEEGKKGGGDVDQRLWKDIRGPAKGDTTWEINVNSVPIGRPVIIRWEMPQEALKAGEKLVLRDNGRLGSVDKPVQTEMAEESSYAFLPGDEGTRSLSLVLSKEDGSSRSNDGSGFGCGTIRPHRDGPSDGGTAILSITLLLIPLLFVKLLRRLTHLRLSI